MNSSLPHATPPYAGEMGATIPESQPTAIPVTQAPAGAPNIVLVLLDDVGFGTCGTFGGPVPTPALDRVAKNGLRYNQFHTTALCSPTRAAMLTGRNHHTVHMGGIPEAANVFPGYDSVIPKEAASVAEILKLSGYSTSCFGKWHLTPMWEQTLAGPFDRWPTGMGFERFYGIINAEASQWEPPLFDQTTPVMPYEGRDDYHMTEDIVDQAISWMQVQKSSQPQKPFFTYVATGAMHCPHHVGKEWIDKFKGHFDGGWDVLREDIYARQLGSGVIPPETLLTQRPEEIPSWADYPDRYKPVASRLMETFAGFLAHTDAQIGRLLDAVEDLGIAENTLFIYITGDNGASAEGTIHGAWSAPSFQNGIPEDPEWLLEHMDDFGSARCENHYNVGWAWALDSPFQWMKQVASHFGGTRNAMALSWPSRIADNGTMRTQFHHVVDVMPTILAAAGIEMPTHVNGLEQLPVDGVSMLYTLDAPQAESLRTTQYFEMFGNRALYHDGWIASCYHGRVPWNRFGSFPFNGPEEKWELYNIREDFSQGNDLALEYPEKLQALREMFDEVAGQHNVYPLREPISALGMPILPPESLGGLKKCTYTSAHIRMPERSVVNLKNCSFRIAATIAVGDGGAHGVIACQGGNMAGWSLYLDDAGCPVYHYNWMGHDHFVARSSTPLSPGTHEIVVDFVYDGGFGAGGDAVLLVDKKAVAHARVERTVPIVFSMSGESFDIGMDTGAAVGNYPHVYRFTGEIRGVTLERLDEPNPEIAARIAEGEFRASIATQ